MSNLIVYFSYSNNTKRIVEEVNKSFKYDVIKIERETPYSKDYNTCAYVEAKKEWEEETFPKLKDININVNEYDSIFLFFPVWWYTFPRVIGTFVKDYLKDYKGEVIVFANSYTNDPKYMENSINDLKKINKNLNIKEGLLNKSIDEHIEFIKKGVK